MCGDAASAGRASEQLLLEWPQLALRFGRVKAALAACKKGAELAPASAELWRQRLVLETQHASFQVSQLASQTLQPDSLFSALPFITQHKGAILRIDLLAYIVIIHDRFEAGCSAREMSTSWF